MRRFAHNVQEHDHPEVITEAEILAEYWDYWSAGMLRVHKSPMITEANCVEDWVVVHWAWELP